MLRRLLGEADGFFALDISTTAIRLIQLSKHSDGWKYERYGYQPLDINLCNDEKVLKDTIKKAINNSDIKLKNVVISTPNEVSNAKVGEVKKMSDEELSKTISSQIKRLESKQGEQNYRYTNLGKSKSDKDKMDVLVASADKGFIENRIELLESIGQNVIAVEPEPLVLIRSAASGDGAELIINIKDFTTDYVISYKKVPYVVKTIPYGAGLFVGMLQQNLKIDTAVAQKYVADYGFNPDIMNGQIIEALGAAISQFTNEIHNLIGSFDRKYDKLKIKKIILTGYGAVIPYFQETIENSTGKTTEFADLWHDIAISDKEKSELSAISMHFAVAIGLAKREAGI